ncbi:unnamed protein product, partial [Pleuronectes platessa]
MHDPRLRRSQWAAREMRSDAHSGGRWSLRGVTPVPSYRPGDESWPKIDSKRDASSLQPYSDIPIFTPQEDTDHSAMRVFKLMGVETMILTNAPEASTRTTRFGFASPACLTPTTASCGSWPRGGGAGVQRLPEGGVMRPRRPSFETIASAACCTAWAPTPW